MVDLTPFDNTFDTGRRTPVDRLEKFLSVQKEINTVVVITLSSLGSYTVQNFSTPRSVGRRCMWTNFYKTDSSKSYNQPTKNGGRCTIGNTPSTTSRSTRFLTFRRPVPFRFPLTGRRPSLSTMVYGTRSLGPVFLVSDTTSIPLGFIPIHARNTRLVQVTNNNWGFVRRRS